MQRPLKKGDVCISKAGHDEGRIYVVIKQEKDGFVSLADGEYRKIENPKRKREKHLRWVGITESKDKYRDEDVKLSIKLWRKDAERG